MKRQRNTFRRRRRPTDGGTALLQQKAFNLRTAAEAIKDRIVKEKARVADAGLSADAVTDERDKCRADRTGATGT